MSLTLTPSRDLPAVDAFIQCAMVMEAQPFLDALVPLPGADAVETLNVGAEGHHQQSYALGQLAGHTVLVITSGSRRTRPDHGHPEDRHRGRHRGWT